MAKRKEHNWMFRICNWRVCAHCGLICLNNKASRKLAEYPCRNGDDE